MIQVKKIQPQTIECFDPEGNSLGLLNEYEFNDLRVQIKGEQIFGYHLYFKVNNVKEIIRIDRDGKLENYPKGFFDTNINLLMKLI